ncbi:hypothetical protein IHE44_0002543, partial [Lamprotornis superbus]
MQPEQQLSQDRGASHQLRKGAWSSLVGESMLGYRGCRSRGASRNTLSASAIHSSWAPEAQRGPVFHQ